MIKKIALIGNQNCGKTTLFNILTGSFQHVGNFPGVTVEQKTGYIKNSQYQLIDLPGIYSLSPYSFEEKVSIHYLLNEHSDIILNIIDATNIERNLYLTLQLMELHIPMILVLNMMDEVILSGNSIDVALLQKHLGISVVPISAYQNKGIDALLKEIDHMFVHPVYPSVLSQGPMSQVIFTIESIMKTNVQQCQLPLRYATTKVIENDKEVLKKLHLSLQQRNIIEDQLNQLEQKYSLDREVLLVEMRYQVIETICQQCVFFKKETSGQICSEKIDRILTHRYFGIPFFIGVILLIFYLTFYFLGRPLQDMMEKGIFFVRDVVIKYLDFIQVDSWLKALIRDGIFAGVGQVLSFLPIILLLFFFLSLLEDSGYMARVAFVMDHALRKIGLSGRSFVPMLMGFGCSVPAIMATRPLTSERDRRLTILLIPFMSCSAKLPIYSMIITAFFPQKALLVIMTLYGIGIFTAILSSFILKSTFFNGEAIPFILELPAYRMPTWKNVILNIKVKAKDFLHKAFTIIFVGSIVIWFMQSFDLSLHYVGDSQQSLLALIGQYLSIIFSPLGFQDWRASTALITGIIAKESVVSTLSVLTAATNTITFNNALITIFTPLSAFSFLVFTVLYMPCIAAFAAMKRELGSWSKAFYTILFQTGMAYLMAFIVYQIGSLFL